VSSALSPLPLGPLANREGPYLRLLCINIFVRDQNRSLRFFVDQLGFSVVLDENYESGGRWVAVAPPDGSTVLALVSPGRKSEDYKLIGRSKHAVLVTEDVMAKFQQWQSRGVRFHHPPQTTLWGGIFTRFDDVDGNTFALVGRDDFVREIEAQRRAAAMKLEAERRVAQELDIAKRVQARLFPQTLPQLKTLEYAGVCIQAREVGGDYYDFLDLGRTRLGLVVGDTSGKGIGAALLMANLQANLRSQVAAAANRPEHFLRSVNQLFYDNTTDSSYATLFFAEYDDRARRLRYANCGHQTIFLLHRDDTLERLESTCTVLGLFKEWNCAIEERRLSPGDVLVVYTDGITEAFNAEQEEFGEHRLIDVLKRNRHRSSREMLTAIVDDVLRFSPHEQRDDITLIVARCKEETKGTRKRAGRTGPKARVDHR
jgi:serine phosphatase RsbU (regulator of sigma subunit)/predicted enzyme related to lactoylglutathione lyase